MDTFHIMSALIQFLRQWKGEIVVKYHGDGQAGEEREAAGDLGGGGGFAEEREPPVLPAAERVPGRARLRCLLRSEVQPLLRGQAGTARLTAWDLFSVVDAGLFRGAGLGARDRVAGGGLA